jgi:hypothetical protein
MKTTIARILILSLGVCLVFATARPGSAEQETDAAKKLLVGSVEAMGGADMMSGWTTRIQKGLHTAVWPGWGTLKADCSEFVKKPDKMKIDRDFSVYNHPFFFVYYYNGGEAWMMVNLGVRQNPRYTSELTDKMKKVDGLPYYLSECDTFFLVPEVPDDSLVTASAIERVGVMDAGDTVLIDLDKGTRLPTRMIIEGGSQHILFADYRSLNGHVVPFHVTIYENGAMVEDFVWEEVTFDEPIDDAIFEEHRPPPKKEAAGG